MSLSHSILPSAGSTVSASPKCAPRLWGESGIRGISGAAAPPGVLRIIRDAHVPFSRSITLHFRAADVMLANCYAHFFRKFLWLVIIRLRCLQAWCRHTEEYLEYSIFLTGKEVTEPAGFTRARNVLENSSRSRCNDFHRLPRPANRHVKRLVRSLNLERINSTLRLIVDCLSGEKTPSIPQH